MKNTIRKSEVAILENLNNLFIHMTAQNCNQKCSHCFINFPKYKKIEDFIKIETVSDALSDLCEQNIECIYLTGAEPMTHPDFNAILRLCLKKANTCICTNGSFINEKKARFLKKVEEESDHEIFFEISLDHYDEVKNDNIRYRGAYRQAIFAVKHLWKYDFTPIIHTVNYYNEPPKVLLENFRKIFTNINYNMDIKHLKITPYYDKTAGQNSDIAKLTDKSRPDCKFGRVLSSKGIYTCPFLADDYRGRCGSSFKNYSDKAQLETDFCNICLKTEYEIFGISPDLYE